MINLSNGNLRSLKMKEKLNSERDKLSFPFKTTNLALIMIDLKEKESDLKNTA